MSWASRGIDQDLGSDEFRTRREHHADQADYRVKGSVSVGQSFRIAFLEHDG